MVSSSSEGGKVWLGSLVDVLALCVQGRASSQPWSAWTLPWPLLLASLNIRGQAGVLVGGSRAGFSQLKSVVGLTLPEVGPMPGHCPRAGFSGRCGAAWGLSCGGGRGARACSAGGLVGSGGQSRRGRCGPGRSCYPQHGGSGLRDAVRRCPLTVGDGKSWRCWGALHAYGILETSG